ncbi:hypothetical protein JW992_14790, partial [candidate division KSB1 bacterium]|nr:hypothetical protein [candidate division KSB1 bacterium]
MKHVLILAGLVGLVFAQSQPDSTAVETGAQLTAFLDRSETPLNRTVELTLRLEWYGELDRYEVYTFDNPLLENLKIISNSSANRVSRVEGKTRSVQDFTYRLQPTNLGMGYVEGMIVRYRDLQEERDFRLTTNRLQVKIVDPIPEPRSKTRLVGLILIFLLIAVGVLGWIYRRRVLERRDQQLREAAAAAIPLEQRCLQELRQIEDDATEADPMAVLNQLVRLLRRFLHEKYSCPGLESTSTEILRDLEQKGLDDRLLRMVQEILNQSDLLKFTGRQADRHEL